MPEALILILLGLFFLFFLYWLPRKKLAHSQRLIQHYNGTFSWLTGTVEIKFENIKYKISRIGRAKGVNDAGASYPALWGYVKPRPQIILGHESSGKYTQGGFLVLPPHEVLSLSNLRILFGCKEQKVIESFKSYLSEPKFSQALEFLFRNDFNHLTVSSEFHLSGFRFKKVYVFKYVCLPETIYARPEVVQEYIENINCCLSQLEIDFERL